MTYNPARSAPLTVGEAVLKSAQYLRERGIESPRLDAELLMAHTLACDRLTLYRRWDMVLSERETDHMRQALRRRGQDREPVARIAGGREFFGRRFSVGRDAFIPRPETEWLVEKSVERLKKSIGDGALDKAAPVVIDVGTGSGCISISIALECPGAVVFATDISEGALGIARDNASALGAGGRVRFHRGDLFAGLDGPFDLVVSNPPYIASEEIEDLAPEVASHDPRSALDGGSSGLDIIERLVPEAAKRMKTGALLLLEIGEGQGRAASAILEKHGDFSEIAFHLDAAGLERYVSALMTAERKKEESDDGGEKTGQPSAEKDDPAAPVKG